MNVIIKLRESDSLWDFYCDKLKAFSSAKIVLESELDALYEDTDVLITTRLSVFELNKFPNLRDIFLFKTGADGIAEEILKNKNIRIHSSHINADAVAEHAIALALALLHRIAEFHNDLSKGIWFSDGKNYKIKNITSMKIGIFGFGHIGKQIAKKLLAFGCNEIFAYNRSGIYIPEVTGVTDLAELVDKSDLVFICVPKTRESTRAFDMELFHKAAGKYIVNISRGEICDEKALFEVLEQGVLSGYASDVWFTKADKTDRTKTVMPSLYPFEELANVVMTPHCATHTQDAHQKYINDAVNQCIQFLQSKNNGF